MKNVKSTSNNLFNSRLTSIISISLVIFLIGLTTTLVLFAGDLSVAVRENITLSVVLNEDAKAWSYKVILDVCKVKPPFGADANNANEFYSALDDYLEGSRKDQSVTFRDPKKEIDKRLKKCQKIISALEKSLNAMRIINFENINTEKRNTFNAVIDSYKVLYQIIDRCTNKVHRIVASWTRFKDDGKEEK